MNAGKLGLLTVGLMFSLTACGIFGSSGPDISSFTATPTTVMPGQSSTLSWQVDSSATSLSISGGTQAIGDVTGQTSVTVTPSATTTYTLTAENADGTSTKTTQVTVSGSTGSGGTDGGTITPPVTPPVDPGDPNSAPTGTFGVSTDVSGQFFNDTGEGGGITSPNDPRVITVAAGSTFYAQVDYTDPDGIQDVVINLANSNPVGLKGPLPSGGFTVGTPTGNCTVGSASATAITCVYPITVEAGTENISALDGAGGEFAYVFRVNVTDTQGNSAANTASGQNRGYVVIN